MISNQTILILLHIKIWKKNEYTITSVEKKGEIYDEDIYVDNDVKNIKCVNTKLINKTKISDEVRTINAKESKINYCISFFTFCKK